MRFEKSFIPYGVYWSTPFCKWQGSFAHLNAITFAAEVARKALTDRNVPVASLDGIALGMTVLQKHQLYGGPWFSAILGAEGITGPMIGQACATGARTVAAAAAEVEVSGEHTVLAVTADRCSNGAHVYFPNPLGPGGMGEKEDIVMDSFGHDQTAMPLEAKDGRLQLKAGKSRFSLQTLPPEYFPRLAEGATALAELSCPRARCVPCCCMCSTPWRSRTSAIT